MNGYAIIYKGNQIETFEADGFYTPEEQTGYFFFIYEGDNKRIVAVFNNEYSFTIVKL